MPKGTAADRRLFRKQNTSYTARDITDVYRRRCDNRYIETFGRRVVDELNEAGHFRNGTNLSVPAERLEKFTGGERCAFSDRPRHAPRFSGTS